MAQFSVDISDALKTISDLANDYPNKVNTFLRRLSDLAVRSARGGYGTSVVVSATVFNDGFVVDADGDAVCFIEFGAGMTAGDGVPIGEYEDIPFDVRPGSWSEEHSQQFSSSYARTGHGWWKFGGTLMDHVTPNPVMYQASEIIKANIIKIAEEVF